MNSLLHYARRLAGSTVRRIPYLRRQLLGAPDYQIISESQARTHRYGGWAGVMTARRQELAYQQLLQTMRAGTPRIDLRVAVEAVIAANADAPNILDVGCGNGYYAEIFEHLLAMQFSYMGIDSSPAMIKSAKQRYPQHTFQVGDATNLPADDKSYDIVFNGVSLMHIMNYQQAIFEAARTAKRACIFHSVPVFEKRQTTFLKKYAYGAPVVEIIFNEEALRQLFVTHGLTVERVWDSICYDVSHVTGEQSSTKTFLCTI